MRIREIEERDNGIIEQIIKHSLEAFGLDIPGTAYFDPQLSALTQFYASEKNAAYWVAVNERDEVVGGIGIAPFDASKGICELQKLYISPAAQGMGLSRQLVETALTFAAKHYTYCYLETMEKLEVANALYEKLGFDSLESPLAGSDHSTMDRWFLKRLGREIKC